MANHRADELLRCRAGDRARRPRARDRRGRGPEPPAARWGPDAPRGLTRLSLRGVFVTGTGTEVGKTVVAAVIARTLARRRACGSPSSSRRSAASTTTHREAIPDHELLRPAAGSRQSDDQIAPYRYGPPVSPHLGAELAGEEIDPERLLAAARAASDGADVLVCEGVGGLLVPLTPGYLVRDFARELALPVVIAANPGLGDDQPHVADGRGGAGSRPRHDARGPHALARRPVDRGAIQPRRDRAPRGDSDLDARAARSRRGRYLAGS